MESAERLSAIQPKARPVPDLHVPVVPPGPHLTPHTWLIQLVRRHAGALGSVLVYAMGVGLLTLATPVAVQALVSNVAFGTLLQPLLVLSLLLLAGLALRGVLRVLQAWVVEALQRQVFVDFVREAAIRLPSVAPAVLRTRHGPELANRFFDIYTVQKATASLLVGGLEAVLTAAVGMTVLAFYHPLLLAFDLVLLIALSGWVWLLGRGGVSSAVEESKAKYALAHVLEQAMDHAESVRSAPGRRSVQQQIDARAQAYLRARGGHFRVVLRQMIGAVTLQAAASAMVLGIGGLLVIERQLTLGQLVAAELIVTGVVAAFATLGKHAETYYDLLAALEKLGLLVTLESERRDGHDARAEAGPLACEVVPAELAGGRLGGRFTLPRGARVRLVGASEHQRTELLRHLFGWESPHIARVRLDGMDMRDLSLDSLRERVALVTMPEIWTGSVLDNLKLEAPEAALFEVRDILDELGLSEELAELEDGLGTLLTPGGGPLSWGQSVRITIARACLRKPRLLLLGGSIDALEPEVRRRLVAALARPERPWTLVLASHDTALDELCTHRLDLDRGALEEVLR